MTRFLAATLGSLVAASTAHADWELNMPVGVTDMSAEIYDLHMMVLGVCTLAAIVTFGAMIYALVKFRKSQGAEAENLVAQHEGRNHLDRGSDADPDCDGRSSRADTGKDRRQP